MRNLFIVLLFISYVGSQEPMKLSLQTGATVTIPCGYDRAYIHHKKYWCSGSLSFSSCSIQAYANNTKGKVTVTDNPAESFFTVTLDHLQTKDTGWYWCGVEIVRGSDVSEALYITVKSDPDLSVRESRVRGEEGGSVTIQCLYSAEYQNTQKQWCSFKDRQCWIFMETKTDQNSAVQLSDDGRNSFSVKMNRLKKSDTGWYWCSAGDLQVPVYISVSVVAPATTDSSVSKQYTCVDAGEDNNKRDTQMRWGFSISEAYVGRQSSMKFSLQTESTVTIPCGYDRAYIHHKKYWCSNSFSFQSCSIQAYANNTNGKVTVTDNPAESFFTVTLDHLQTKDTGWYWCGVEIDGGSDVSEALQITVISDPDLSVNETRVRGVKGGSVTVQCLYSAAYQNTQKQWCRFKDGQCYTMRTETSQNSAVYTSDDGRRSFSVRMSGLKKSDVGWYWCRAGDLQVPVHIAVNNLTATTDSSVSKEHIYPEMFCVA
ncbi:polymeric immunoglobulin receptor-like [Tachysurus fulvidraco]|uniref:polymeric immunoglobulin receptor-like n=1 Tax=Tachysurus fulvidraco TaxID=1234273 RepID=UPI001FEF0840|nr:polymeric immunoglobulin receptor-like [Tachysurus fulvidraco]